MLLYHLVMNDWNPSMNSGQRPRLTWRGTQVARLRVRQKRFWFPFFAMALFLGGWYFLLFNQVDFTSADSPWRALWLTLKAEPGLAIPLLLPLLPLAMITRDTLGGDYMEFNREKGIITRRGRRKLGFDDVEALVIRAGFGRVRRYATQLSMRRRGGQKIFLCRCVDYTDCSALAQEIATLIGAPVRSERAGKG